MKKKFNVKTMRGKEQIDYKRNDKTGCSVIKENYKINGNSVEAVVSEIVKGKKVDISVRIEKKDGTNRLICKTIVCENPMPKAAEEAEAIKEDLEKVVGEDKNNILGDDEIKKNMVINGKKYSLYVVFKKKDIVNKPMFILDYVSDLYDKKSNEFDAFARNYKNSVAVYTLSKGLVNKISKKVKTASKNISKNTHMLFSL